MSSGTPFAMPTALHFPSTHFCLSAATASFHAPSKRVLIVEDGSFRSRGGYFFLPRGRKDIGESISACAIRETWEEGGYRVELLKGTWDTKQPSVGAAPTVENRDDPDAWKERSATGGHEEAFFVSLVPFIASGRAQLPTHFGEVAMYLCHYFLATIPEPAERDKDYGKGFVGKHEAAYNGMLVPVEEAVELLSAGRVELKAGGLRWKQGGEEVNWQDLQGNNEGVVQALIVARGWEEVRKIVQTEGKL
jgi:8-oxo-dGTP pyrophosphatase MutT (NUDIX family)